MSFGRLLENLKISQGLAVAADRYNGDPASDVVSLKMYDRVVFLLHQVTAGTNTGTATVTIEACDNFTPSNTSAIAFTYYKNESFGTADAWSAAQSAAAAGFSTTANKTALYAVEIKAADLPEGYPCVRMQLTETVDDPVTAGVLILLGDPRYATSPDSLPSAIA